MVLSCATEVKEIEKVSEKQRKTRWYTGNRTPWLHIMGAAGCLRSYPALVFYTNSMHTGIQNRTTQFNSHRQLFTAQIHTTTTIKNSVSLVLLSRLSKNTILPMYEKVVKANTKLRIHCTNYQVARTSYQSWAHEHNPVDERWIPLCNYRSQET